jgi:hypothetical protein
MLKFGFFAPETENTYTFDQVNSFAVLAKMELCDLTEDVEENTLLSRHILEREFSISNEIYAITPSPSTG